VGSGGLGVKHENRNQYYFTAGYQTIESDWISFIDGKADKGKENGQGVSLPGRVEAGEKVGKAEQSESSSEKEKEPAQDKKDS
jgi:hypothetical protein